MITSSTRIVANNVNAIKATLRKDALKKAASAGGLVVSNNAKLNIANTFKDVHGARGLSQIIMVVVESTPDKCTVDIGPTVIYGRIHELGGIIKPVRAKMLSWVDEDGNRIFAKVVHMPARPYLRPAMDDHLDEIQEAVKFQIQKAIRASLMGNK